MKFNNTTNYLTLGEVAQLLKVSNNTIKRWYDWYEDDTYIKPHGFTLPDYHYFDKRGTKYFNKLDIPIFEQIYIDINKKGKYYGCMAEYNKKFIKKKEVK